MRFLRACAIALATLPAALAQSPAQRIADLLTDRGCGIVIESQRTDWRDATAQDYATDGWTAWKKFTGSQTPWRATGDFDGDGLADVAKVVIRIKDGAWMLGVEFGHDAQRPCRRAQIASNMIDELKTPIFAVQTLPKGAKVLPCHHAAERFAALCRVPEASALERRTTDALIIGTDNASALSAYLWSPDGESKRSDGSPLMVFNQMALEVGMDMADAIAQTNASSSAAQKGDRISAAQRKQVVAQFDAAFNNASKRAYRAVSTTATNESGGSSGARSIVEFTPPRKMRTLTDDHGAVTVDLIHIEDNAWLKSGNGYEKLHAPWPIPEGAGIGPAVITALRDEKRAGRSLRTLDLAYSLEGVKVTVTKQLTIDVERALPVRQVDSVQGQVTTSTYDFEAKFAPIEAPR